MVSGCISLRPLTARMRMLRTKVSAKKAVHTPSATSGEVTLNVHVNALSSLNDEQPV